LWLSLVTWIKGPKNAVAVIHKGQIKARYFKQHLPNYGVFDEFRNFKPGDQNLIVRIQGVDVAIAICEDIWHPVDSIAARKPGLLVVPNGSPFERNKDDVRLALVKKTSTRTGRTYCLCKYDWRTRRSNF
jgi:NAD+ synthase (glutamine-hydrolysing)